MKYVRVLRSCFLMAIASVLGFAAYGQESPKVLILPASDLTWKVAPASSSCRPRESEFASTLGHVRPDARWRAGRPRKVDAPAIPGRGHRGCRYRCGRGVRQSQGATGLTDLYDELTGKRRFALRPVLLGRSRGGLWVTSWASANPDKVAGIAGIYPVFDLRTYPSLAKAAPAFELSEAELRN